MTEADWLGGNSVDAMLHYLRDEAKVVRSAKGRRKLRLFAGGCCRQVWDLIEDPRSRRLVELAEQLADGQVDPTDLAEAETAARAAKTDADAALAGLSCMTHTRKVGAAIGAALQTAAKEAYEAARVSSISTLCSVGGQWRRDEVNPEWDAQEKRQANLLRCLFNSPFRPLPPIRTSWLQWNEGTIAKLAQSIYADRAFDRMPILADALEEAGCQDADILGHCRQPGVHARGCWLIDLLTGRS